MQHLQSPVMTLCKRNYAVNSIARTTIYNSITVFDDGNISLSWITYASYPSYKKSEIARTLANTPRRGTLPLVEEVPEIEWNWDLKAALLQQWAMTFGWSNSKKHNIKIKRNGDNPVVVLYKEGNKTPHYVHANFLLLDQRLGRWQRAADEEQMELLTESLKNLFEFDINKQIDTEQLSTLLFREAHPWASWLELNDASLQQIHYTPCEFPLRAHSVRHLLERTVGKTPVNRLAVRSMTELLKNQTARALYILNHLHEWRRFIKTPQDLNRFINNVHHLGFNISLFMMELERHPESDDHIMQRCFWEAVDDYENMMHFIADIERWFMRPAYELHTFSLRGHRGIQGIHDAFMLQLEPIIAEEERRRAEQRRIRMERMNESQRERYQRILNRGGRINGSIIGQQPYKMMEDIEHRGYRIVSPKTTDEIIRWGTHQHHCVGSYSQDALHARVLLFAIYDEEDKHIATASVRWNRLGQFYGPRNSQVPDEVKQAFLEVAYKHDVVTEIDPAAAREPAPWMF